MTVVVAIVALLAGALFGAISSDRYMLKRLGRVRDHLGMPDTASSASELVDQMIGFLDAQPPEDEE